MEWVSIKERLPELIDRGIHRNRSSDDVLVFNGRISVGCRWICGKYEYFLSNEESDRDNVTHWMPLPKPPKE